MRTLRVATGTYLAFATTAAAYAIAHDLRAEPFGIRLPLGIWPEFLVGWGTAISPGLPLYIVLAALLALTWRPTRAQSAATLLGVLGLLMIAGYMVERVMWSGFEGDRAAAGFALGGIAIAGAMILGARAAR